MRLTSRMKWLVVTAMGSVLWLCGCDRTAQPNTDKPPPVTTPEEVDMATQELAPTCEIERQRFVLLEGHWQSECLKESIPRTSAIWTSDGHQVATLVNERCEDTEEQKVVVLRNEEVRQTSVRIERRAGRGGAIAFHDQELLIIPGESCRVPAFGLIIHRLNLTTEKVDSRRHFDVMTALWPSLSMNGERVWMPLAFSDVYGLLPDSQVGVMYGCIHVWPVNPEYAGCIVPSLYNPDTLGAVALTWESSHDMKELFVGRGLTWAQDLATGQLLNVGAINTPSRQLKEFVLTPNAWALHEYRAARRLPVPPVMGDGVQLLYDGDRRQMILLDPASTQSWLLEKDYRRWVPLEHEPLRALAEQFGELENVSIKAPLEPLRTPPTRAELDAPKPPIWRNTDHLAPWFATYDLERHAIVVYPYRPEGVFCLPVQGKPGETVCLASHS